MIELRPYQTRVIDEARQAYRDRARSVLLCMPTGAGKTYTASTVVHGAAAKRKTVWWLTHRKELIRQGSRAFHNLGIPHGTVMAGHISNHYASVQVASVQTIINRLDELAAPDLIVFDECHHIGSASWSSIDQHFPNARTLGLTATPWRLDGQGLGRWFQKMVMGPTVAELIEGGSLSPYRLFAPATPDLSGVSTTAGDFQRGSLAKAMSKPAITGDAIGHYLKICQGKRAIAFCAGIENSRALVAQALAAGIPAEHVDANTPELQREGAIERLTSGETMILSNDSLFGEGVDVPAVEVVIDLSPSKSLSKVMQNWGRALRMSAGKSEAIILDHAGNSLIHGLPDDVREWSLEDREKKSRAAPSEVPIKQCGECFFVYRPAPKCPQCGHVAEVKAREIEVVEGTLAEVRKDDLRSITVHTPMREIQTLEGLRTLARLRGYKRGWATHVWNERLRKEGVAA